MPHIIETSHLLAGFENAPPLPTTLNEDGKSLANLPREDRSTAYETFPAPIRPLQQGNAFDFHIYYVASNPKQAQHAKELHERIRREFPEFRVYKLWDKAVGPHPVPMFEVNTFTPHQTGTLFGFLTVNRGPLSVLIHPNTGNPLRDHTELCCWLGQPWPLILDM